MARKKKEKHRYTSIGGQALMEGIMMRGPEKTVMCVRRANGEIVSETIENVKQNKANKIPIVRGVVSFVQSMALGTKLLMRSAEIAIEDEIAAEKAEEEKAKAVTAEAVEEAAEETTEAVEEAAEETTEAVEEAAEKTTEAVEEAAEKTTEAVEEAAEETTEAVEEAAEETTEAVEEAAEETAEAVESKADKPVEPVAKKSEKPAAAVEEKQKKGGKFLKTLGCILCLALAAFLFFWVAPIATTALTESLFPAVMPQSFIDRMAAAPEKWEFITSIVVKVIFLLAVFGIISVITRDPEKAKQKKKDDSFESGPLLVLSTILGFGLALLLFVYAPTWITSALFKWVFPNILPQKTAAHMATQAAQNVWRPIIEGIIKIIILVAYMAVCSTMKEIKTLFRYHGAEHKTIFCYEAGEELTVENVRKFKRFHPRCGTSFLILMLLVGIIAGMAIKYLLPADIANSNLWYPLIKIGLIPLIMGVGYELLKMCGKHDNVLTRIIAAPGLWMQRITTKEPTDAMIECAIAAIKPVIPENGEDMQLEKLTYETAMAAADESWQE